MNLDALTEDERNQLFEIERVTMFYLPRICNHCANPACVAACPSGALYKRGEDGIVLVNQDLCSGWRACVAACPYKKIYFNWKTGKSEKCVLCYPRLETGQAPSCFHSCVGRIRYTGVLLYDASRLPEVLRVPNQALVESQATALLNPHDPEVITQARANGISEGYLEAAQKSPVWKYVMEWKLALPLHAEYRTLPMLYYVPPLLPTMGKMEDGKYNHAESSFFSGLKQARIPVKYLASLFSAGNTQVIETVLKKLMAVRYFMRSQTVKDLDARTVAGMLEEVKLTPELAREIYAMTAIPTVYKRYALPPMHREEAIGATCSPETCKGGAGFGYSQPPKRGL